MSRAVPTIALLEPTGLDRGTRQLLVGAVQGYSYSDVLRSFFAGTWADLDDYLDGLDQTGRSEAAAAIRTDVFKGQSDHNQSVAVLRQMPDADFLDAIERLLPDRYSPYQDSVVTRLHGVCERRGVPYRLNLDGKGELKFEWVGDPVVESEVLAPALSALDDPRLSGGPQDEFVAARAAIREGTPQAHRRAVAEACNAVESGLSVLLLQHQQPVPPKPVLSSLLKACRDADLFPKATNGKSVPIDHVLGAAGRFGNERGRHGAGEEPHGVEPVEAEAVVAAAAVALTLIARRLPSQ